MDSVGQGIICGIENHGATQCFGPDWIPLKTSVHSMFLPRLDSVDGFRRSVNYLRDWKSLGHSMVLPRLDSVEHIRPLNVFAPIGFR